MILGLGIDVVEVDRMRRWGATSGLFDRYFHPQELAESLGRGASAILSLAARFAVKEAFGKALGTGLRGLQLRDIQVENNSSGKPEVRLHGTASAALDAFGGRRVHVSLTHERENAIAVVIIEGDDGERR